MSVAEGDEGHSWAKVPCVLIRWEAPPKATFLVQPGDQGGVALGLLLLPVAEHASGSIRPSRREERRLSWERRACSLRS